MQEGKGNICIKKTKTLIINHNKYPKTNRATVAYVIILP